MRETIEGVLHVIRTRKQRQGADVFEKLIVAALEDAGTIQAEFYPPTYFILTSQTVGERRADEADSRNWRNDEPFQFRFKGQPNAFSHELAGHEVSVRATVDRWPNGLGGYLHCPRVLTVGEYVKCHHHNDPYRGQKSGSSRIYCNSWLRELEPA